MRHCYRQQLTDILEPVQCSAVTATTAPGSDVILAVNGCNDQSPSLHLEETGSQLDVVSATVNYNQTLVHAQERLDSSCDEACSSSMVVDYEQESSITDTHIAVAEAYRSDKNQSSSHDQEYFLSASSYDPLVERVMNGSAETGVGDKSDALAVEDRLAAENSDSSTYISIVDKLDKGSASHDEVQLVSVDSDPSLLESSVMALTDTNTVDVALSSCLSQPAGISVAHTATHTSPEDSQAVPVHAQLVIDTECMSAVSLDAASVPRLRHDRRSVSSIGSDTCASSISLGARTGSDILPNIVSISHSSEKLWSWPNRRERAGFDSQAVGVVRSSWSQENYFDDSDITCVDIDLDDDDLASSVDVLHYRDSAGSGDTAAVHSWTEDDMGRGDALSTGKLRSWAPLKGDEVFAELFSSNSESSLGDSDYSSAAFDFRKKAAKTYGVGVAIDFDPSRDSSDTVISSSSSSTGNAHRLTNWNGLDSSASGSDNSDDLSDDISFPPSVFSDIATRPSSKDVDRPSAARLAKRLYYLQGFRKSDISRHLTKKYGVVCTSCITCI